MNGRSGYDQPQSTGKIRNWGFSGNKEEVVAKALNSTGGFNLVLAGAKFFLEHGVEPGLVVDHAPDTLAVGWSMRRRQETSGAV